TPGPASTGPTPTANPGRRPNRRSDEVSDADLANLSDKLMLTTVVMYVVALAAYAVDLGFGRRRAAAAAEKAEAKAEAKVPAGAGARADTADTAESAAGTAGEPAGEDEDGRTRIDWVRLAVLMTALGWAAHLGVMVTRGLAATRWPWGNMYEFLTAIAFAAVTAFMIVMYRYGARY